MTSKNKAGSLGAICAVMFMLLSPGANALAATPSSQGACGLDQAAFDKLQAVQNDPSLNYVDEIKAELQIRKDLLSQTVDCAIQNARSLQESLNATAVKDPDVGAAQAQASGRITDAIAYYELQKTKIADLGIQGSKDFSSSLGAWRAGNYNPAAKEASDIILWTGNQDLIATAQNRMNHMKNTIDLLNLVGNNDLETLWKDAQSDFKETADLNQSAKDALRGATDPNGALDLIKSSLDSLSATYQKLFDLNDKIVNPSQSSQK